MTAKQIKSKNKLLKKKMGSMKKKIMGSMKKKIMGSMKINNRRIIIMIIMMILREELTNNIQSMINMTRQKTNLTQFLFRNSKHSNSNNLLLGLTSNHNKTSTITAKRENKIQ
jgi:hypothetical protein